MVSGVVTIKGVSSLERITKEVKLTGNEYLSILQTHHIPITRRVMKGQPFTFIHVPHWHTACFGHAFVMV
jgi:hypothetical protein